MDLMRDFLRFWRTAMWFLAWVVPVFGAFMALWVGGLWLFQNAMWGLLTYPVIIWALFRIGVRYCDWTVRKALLGRDGPATWKRN